MVDLKEQIRSLFNDPLKAEVLAIRRHLHRHPELSFQEHRTSAYIREKLDSWGIPYEFPVAGTGILAWIRGSNPGKRIALRTDMDALPISEETGLEFQSAIPGVMHACGHDIHMASLLGAIRLLDRLREEIRGEILFVFQPGEEKVPGGARLMLDAGIFREREPDMIIAQHVLPEMDAGHVGFRAGNYMASNDEIYITVKGRGGHGALPQHINDPVLMASHILISLQQEINRKAPAGVPTVISFGKVVANGAVNVIPDQVILEGTFRTMHEEWRGEAHRLIRQLAGGIAGSMGGGCEVEIRSGYPVLHNNEPLTEKARAHAVEFLGPGRVEAMTIRMTAEDFAWFAQSFPGMMFRVGVKEPGSDKIHPLHTRGFIADETVLATSVPLLAYLALTLPAEETV